MAPSKPSNESGTHRVGNGLTGTGAPTMLPSDMAIVTDERPRELSRTEMALAERAVAVDATPTLEPPPSATTGGNAGASLWRNDQRVSALWINNANRNSWVAVVGVGWKKLANTSDSSVIALSILAAHAKQMQSNFTCREEADGMIYEIYDW